MAKLAFAAGEGTRVTLLGTLQDQPDSQDPLGLTRAQWDADPRGVTPAARAFDTRKSVRQVQGGVRVEHAFSGRAALTTIAYAGRRDVLQYLAFSGAAPTSSGGVVDLARDYGGVGLRIATRHDVAGRPPRLVAGVEFDRLEERRRGFVNDFGTAGALRRDETDEVDNRDAFVQAEWSPSDALTLTAGVRTSRVRFVGERQRVNVAAFRIDSSDEIVVDVAAGGRTTFRNAGETRRRGAEIAYEGRFGPAWAAHVALTWLDAVFASDVTTGQPPAVVPAGNRLPGVPRRTAYAEVVWTPAVVPWLEAAGEVLHVDDVFVNDANSEAAPAYTVGSLRLGAKRQVGGWTLAACARVDNVADRRYAGSVIVGDANGRYYEPAPGRTWFAGLSAHGRF